MAINSREFYYCIGLAANYLNNAIILITFALAVFWILLRKSELEAWIALFGIVSIILSKVPGILKKLGYEQYPLGEGVISKGGCWIDEGKEESKIKLQVNADNLTTKIDYIPTERVMAHISNGFLIFKRRAGDSGHKLRVDYELVKKNKF